MWIKKTVQDLIEKHQTNDSFIIARQMNINIIEHDLHEDIYGFYRYVRRNKFIFINSNLAEHKKKFVCEHELGHVILHPEVNTPFMRSNTYFSIDKIEHQANRFAIELAIPDELLQEYILERMTLFDIANLHHVPVELIKLKFLKFT
ncbi:ImmA/IrrE family metallo-endopeptidase [Lysinibacillus capsici]|uniref:ImmA/IrrE family metallo-endopeptidase n=1 Tax=Lysinibacillus capsici TaxID=2115968 RepID=UPI001C0F7C8F|nr:ImmA/IrrE family metallo-endopeptidase [Lysinibacillus capsici]MBU5250552.1 ImmA/IrrE family metallo-endopeptidase [Lysinibacillus capsici]